MRRANSCRFGYNFGRVADETRLDGSNRMKKKNGVARALDPILRERLETMLTKALLARLKKLHWCEEKDEFSGLTDEEVLTVEGKILFKDSDIWKQAYNDLKAILANREHIVRKVSIK